MIGSLSAKKRVHDEAMQRDDNNIQSNIQSWKEIHNFKMSAA
jgi:hypothetical protein